ncbi:MAG TPA: glycosyltransferase 87 family protein [Candidatus Limnocylindria bacterium]|nr:glycosyltransferase 87 family protein [Candidatus Limnocylindria bacterium]
MGALIRVAAITLAGAVLYFAGLVNGMVIYRPEPLGAGLVGGGIASAAAMVVVALHGDGRGDAGSRPLRRYVGVHRVAWLLASVMALVGMSWLVAAPRQHGGDWTPYHNDAIALNECAARSFLAGGDPYADLDIFTCYARLGIGADRTTPLRQGLFARDGYYPSDDELDRVWAIRSHDSAANVEFESKVSYPALSFVLIAPWVALGLDTNALYVLCLVLAMTLVLARASTGVRPFVFTGLLGAAGLAAFTVGGSVDLLYALPLVAAWLWRERCWSGIVFGIAMAAKQIAWFFAPFFFIAVGTRKGWRAALRWSAEAVAVFVVTNLPFVLADQGAWVAGVLSPVRDPMFPRGAGLIFLVTNGVIPLWPQLSYALLEGVGLAVCIAIAWRLRRTSPELGVVLPLLPLFFAYRSLFSYFFLLPMFAFAGLVRLPLGQLDAAAARDAGGLTLFALPQQGARERDAAAVPAGD